MWIWNYLDEGMPFSYLLDDMNQSETVLYLSKWIDTTPDYVIINDSEFYQSIFKRKPLSICGMIEEYIDDVRKDQNVSLIHHARIKNGKYLNDECRYRSFNIKT